MTTYLEFEKPIEALDSKIVELKSLNDSAPSEDMLDKISKVELEISDTYKKIYSNISPWQRTLVARHPDRPKTKQYIEHLIDCLLYTSPSPRDGLLSRMPSSA